MHINVTAAPKQLLSVDYPFGPASFPSVEVRRSFSNDSPLKYCGLCKSYVPVFLFSKDSNKKDGLKSNCKVCTKAKDISYYNNNKAKILSAKKTYRKKNKQAINEKRTESSRRFYKENKQKINKKCAAYQKKRRQSDPLYKLSRQLRDRLKSAISSRQENRSAIKHLGCTVAELKTYLESLFKDGMSWENRSEWHIDHIKPLSSFDLTNKDELLVACNYKNLQPLWAIENLKKGAKQ